MSILIPENTVRKLDGIGRVTLPKGLRDRWELSENSELELFTATLDGRNCICLAKPRGKEEEVEAAIELLTSFGYLVEERKNG